jgi:hypothetical protein
MPLNCLLKTFSPLESPPALALRVLTRLDHRDVILPRSTNSFWSSRMLEAHMLPGDHVRRSGHSTIQTSLIYYWRLWYARTTIGHHHHFDQKFAVRAVWLHAG